ncbi:hypothetical protein RHA1_ro11112 (plasmid) [Rhodococcus jostii RHA1]|uniref:Uncharacterized protein n=1 Tax=Rhodococcus jostii (strain RHA1) TaxID=101510 RepID=Q0RVC7_RHOJR|nr:hypothetical protein RHA1_ro11112 [Rhodococcus jostii RHA1]
MRSTKTGAEALADIAARIEAHLATHDRYFCVPRRQGFPRRPRPGPPRRTRSAIDVRACLDCPETYDYLTVAASRNWPLPYAPYAAAFPSAVRRTTVIAALWAVHLTAGKRGA